jgi:hypothetical protein
MAKRYVPHLTDTYRIAVYRCPCQMVTVSGCYKLTVLHVRPRSGVIWATVICHGSWGGVNGVGR